VAHSVIRRPGGGLRLRLTALRRLYMSAIAVNKKTLLPTRASGGWPWNVLIYTSMSMPTRMVILALAILVLGMDATASARPKKHSAARTSTVTTACDGTPIIMAGMECPRRPARREEQAQEPEQEQATKRAQRPRFTTRGSSGAYIPPVQRTPSVTLQQPSAGVYIPPPVNNPSERINQLNQSFPLNGGLGNNPTNRDEYIRYNLNR
jgi:hypothetical protein